MNREGNGPIVWVVDDNPRQLELVREWVSTAFPRANIRTYADVGDAEADVEAGLLPHLAIIDLWLDSDEGQGLGGVALWSAIRQQRPRLPVIVRSAYIQEAPDALRDSSTMLVDKSDHRTFMNQVESCLALGGFDSEGQLEVTPLGVTISARSPLVAKSWLVGALAAAGGLWVATCLPAVSQGSQVVNALLIAFGILGGGLLGLGRIARRMERALSSAGAVLIIGAGLILPLLL